MAERIEFGSKAAADSFREEHVAHLCSDDDRRLKTVAIVTDYLWLIKICPRGRGSRTGSIVPKIRDLHFVFEHAGLKIRVSDDELVTGCACCCSDHEITGSHPFTVDKQFVLESRGFECDLLIELECANAAKTLSFRSYVRRTTTECAVENLVDTD